MFNWDPLRSTRSAYVTPGKANILCFRQMLARQCRCLGLYLGLFICQCLDRFSSVLHNHVWQSLKRNTNTCRTSELAPAGLRIRKFSWDAIYIFITIVCVDLVNSNENMSDILQSLVSKFDLWNVIKLQHPVRGRGNTLPGRLDTEGEIQRHNCNYDGRVGENRYTRTMHLI
jgi:hypothetical protein